VKTAKYLI
jgi:hypothetical protein